MLLILKTLKLRSALTKLTMKYRLISLVTCLVLQISVAFAQAITQATVDLETTFIEAEIDKYLNNSDKQEEKLLKCLEKDRRNPEINYQLARLHVTHKDYRKAIDYANKAVSFSPQNKWYHLLTVDINELMMDFTAANQALLTVSQMEPDNSVFLYRIANNALQNGNWKESLQTLETIQSKFGVTDKATFKMLEIVNTREDYSKGLEILNTAVAAAPYNVEILNALANQNLLLGKEKAAEKIYRQVLDIDEGNVIANRQIVSKDRQAATDSEYLYAITPLIDNPNLPFDAKIMELIPYVEQLQTDRDPQLISALQSLSDKIITRYPDEAKAYAIRGDIMYLTGELLPALKSYDKTLALNDAVYTVWSQKMNLLYDLKQYKDLIQFSEKSIDYYPNQYDGYFWQSIGQYESGDHDEAQAYADEMKLVSGGNPRATVMSDLIGLLIGKCNPDQVNSLVKKSNADDSNDPLLYHLIGRAYAKAGDASQASRYHEMAQALGYVSQ